MSRPPRTQQCTVWTIGEEDPFTGFPAANTVRVYLCEMMQGGKTKYANTSGTEFVPKSTFWIRADEVQSGVHVPIATGEYIAKGNHAGVTDPNLAGAEEVKNVITYDNSKFAELDSYEVMTG